MSGARKLSDKKLSDKKLSDEKSSDEKSSDEKTPGEKHPNAKTESNTADSAELFSRLCAEAADGCTLGKLVFSKPAADAYITKISGAPVVIADKKLIQFTLTHSDGKNTHVNIPPCDVYIYSFARLTEFSQGNLITPLGECEYRKNKRGDTVIGGEKLARKLRSGTDGDTPKVEAAPHDRKKEHILDASEPFMRSLGIADKNGVLCVGMRGKFRQINRFLEYVRDLEPKLPHTVNVADLCCGKSYLSFAVYIYLVRAGHEVHMSGVDLKADVIDYCAALAKNELHTWLGVGADNGSTTEFLCADIACYVPTVKPDLVVSLHACDVATDIVLDFAVRNKVPFILSTPCCQHELNHTINCPPLAFVTDYSMLRQKLCEAATDALRCAKLKMNGYAVEAVELVDPEDTPKNVLIRAVLERNFDRENSSPEAAAARKVYEDARTFLGI